MFADAPKDLARSGDRVQVQVADATRLSFPDGSFDYVFSFISLPVDRSMLTTGRGGFVVRFRLRKQLT